ncbi:ROK family protein [Nonomuraea polychroma]|uniref:ROK family protein n=1 Tax=Nonomuraea polychroma TaxID=46176 RepID=UPI003D89CA14
MPTKAPIGGPNARLYGLVADRAHVAGVDLRRSAVNVTVADITGEVVGRATRAIDGSASPGSLRALIVDAVTAAAGKRVLDTVVIGAPGLVDPRDGELISGEGEVPGWRRGVVGSVRQRLDVPVVLGNEVNLAALAELRSGAARGSEDFVLLWLDDGVGRPWCSAGGCAGARPVVRGRSASWTWAACRTANWWRRGAGTSWRPWCPSGCVSWRRRRRRCGRARSRATPSSKAPS